MHHRAYAHHIHQHIAPNRRNLSDNISTTGYSRCTPPRMVLHQPSRAKNFEHIHETTTAEQMRKVSPDTTEIAQRTIFLSNVRRRLEAGDFSRRGFADTTQLIHTYNFVQYFIHPQYGSSLWQNKKGESLQPRVQPRSMHFQRSGQTVKPK